MLSKPETSAAGFVAGRVHIGKIARYVTTRGFGFIECPSIDKNVFFHVSAISDQSSIPEIGDEVEFCIVEGGNSEKSKPRASTLKIIRKVSPTPKVEKPRLVPQEVLYDQGIRPGRLMTSWSNIPLGNQHTSSADRMGNCLLSLKAMAVKEPWEFQANSGQEFELQILDNYLRYTFYRLSRERKIAFVDGYATFNTGLVNDLYLPIYALFSQNRTNNSGMKPFSFVEFCIPGAGKSGRLLIKLFNVLPEPAIYFTQVSDVVFDASKDFYPQYDHILDDGIRRDRYPPEFLKSFAPSKFSWSDAEYKSCNKEFLTAYVNALRTDAKAYRAMKERLDQAIALARKKARWNYRTGVPIYYPDKNSMSLLLPLTLSDENSVDLTLVTAKVSETAYYASTVLPIKTAYMDARIVCRPESDWLFASAFTTVKVKDAKSPSQQVRICGWSVKHVGKTIEAQNDDGDKLSFLREEDLIIFISRIPQFDSALKLSSKAQKADKGGYMKDVWESEESAKEISSPVQILVSHYGEMQKKS